MAIELGSVSMSLPFQFLLVLFAGWVNREQQAVVEYLKAENRVLRVKLGRRRVRFTDAERRRLGRMGRAIGRRALQEVGSIVTPDTILRWYRELVAKKYTPRRGRHPGRPSIASDVRKLIVRMAVENGTWGYGRIQGALKNLGCVVGRTTIKRVLASEGLAPAPIRGRGTPWKAFIRAHWDGLAAMDFFTVEALTVVGLVRYHVLFVIDVASRHVHICGVRHRPTGRWMHQIARNLTDAEDGFLLGKRFVLHDRDPLFTEAFRRVLKEEEIEPLRLPAKSPNLNAHAERFVLSVKSECLNKLIILGERHLRSVLAEFSAHYHFERNHQGVDNKLLALRASDAADNDAHVVCDQRVGGLLKYYRRAA